jgi:DNA polymerase III alpha subunit (gram-positive type)
MGFKNSKIVPTTIIDGLQLSQDIQSSCQEHTKYLNNLCNKFDHSITQHHNKE